MSSYQQNPTALMFSSNPLPLPSPFARENHLRHRSADPIRVLPTGECKYILLHPASQNQQCSCQSFHHNRGAPGTICECGHQACYHVPGNIESNAAAETINAVAEKLNFVIDKVRRLEEVIQHERSSREASLQRERQLWERDIRVLREALAPFYTSEKEWRRRVMEVEDRVEGNYDEQVRLRDRTVAIDDSAMWLEKRVEDLEGARSKRRRMGCTSMHDQPFQNGYVSSDADNFRRISSSNDGASAHTPSSRALSPAGAGAQPVREEPRSSGILNLVAEMPRPAIYNMPPRMSPPQDEVRSSGFLTLDLTDRLKEKSISPPDLARYTPPAQTARITPPQERASPMTTVHPNQDNFPRRSPSEPMHTKLPTIDIMILPGNTSPRKRKLQFDHLALDVLADVSVASPLVR